MVIGTDYIGSYKSNYHTIMTTTTPVCLNIGISWRHFKLESLKACILKGIIYNSDGESCAVLCQFHIDYLIDDLITNQT